MAADVFQLVGSVAVNTSTAVSNLNTLSTTGNNTNTSLSTAFKSIGTAVTTYFTVTKLVDFGKEMVNLATQAETASAKVKTLLADGTDTAQYEKDIIAASTATGVSMQEYAEATYQAISASVDQADAINFVTDAVKLAKGGFTSTTTAVDVLTTAMNAYGDESLTASHISDVLITTQNLGKTTVDQLASSMGKVIPIASAYGVNIENLGSAYATMTAGGIATAESSTYLKSMLNELADGSKAVGMTLEEKTGKSFAELMASGSSLGDVLNIIYEATGKDATAFAQLWSSTEAGTGALAIVNAGVENFNDTVDQMGSSEGATDTAYETMTDTFAAKTQKLQTTLENAGISIGEKFLPVLGEIVDSITEFLIPAFESISNIIDVVFTEDGVDWSAIGGMIGDAIGSLLENLPTMLQTAWDEVLWPFISGLVKATLGIELPKWEDISQAFTDWWDGLKESVAAIITTIFSIKFPSIADVQAAINKWWNDILSGVSLFLGFGVSTPSAPIENADNKASERKQEAFMTSGIDPTDQAAVMAYFASGGSFANGLEFVNRDQMPALLHYGEAVLDRTEAREWREEKAGGGSNKTETVNNNLNVGTINMNREMDAEAFFEQYNDFTTRRNRGYGWG